MDLNKVNIVIRPRPAYEGLDLGFAMASRWFLTLWLLWLATALPTALVVSALAYNRPHLAFLVIWWLKPLYETLLLYWLSRMIFGEDPGMKSMMKSIVSIVRPRLLTRLTLRRFSPSRSFYMPVILLENMRGKDYSKRTSILGHNETAGITLTLICFLFEWLLLVTAMVFLYLLVPESLLSFNLGHMFSQEEPLAAMACNLVYVGALSVMAPFYVAAGFSLYLTRRTRLEAWDIELNFKRLVERKKQAKKTLSLILTCVILATCMGHGAAHASERSKEEAKKSIEEILKQEDFGKKETVTYWRLKKFEKDEPAEPSEGLMEFIGMLVSIVVVVAKSLLWLAGAVVVALFLYFGLKYAGMLKPRGKEQVYTPPEELFGLKLTKDSLPGDLPAEVRKRLAEDDVRGALSLLYRGALYKLIYVFFLDIPKSATEGECMTLVARRREQEESAFFGELTRVWQKMAYGHIRPETRQVENLCEAWSHYYTS